MCLGNGWPERSALLQAITSGIFREVREAEFSGRLVFVKSTEYNRMLDQLVRSGTHAFVGEDLSGRVLMANDFSTSGNILYTSKTLPGETHTNWAGTLSLSCNAWSVVQRAKSEFKLCLGVWTQYEMCFLQ